MDIDIPPDADMLHPSKSCKIFHGSSYNIAWLVISYNSLAVIETFVITEDWLMLLAGLFLQLGCTVRDSHWSSGDSL